MPKLLRRILVVGGAAIVVGFGAIQLVPVDRSNPAASMDVEAPPPVRAILRRSCYDCHSNETRCPWYSRVAPVSWLVADDVAEGREHLDFSTWDSYSASDRARAVEKIEEETAGGGMPLGIYLFMHRDARLSADDLRTLADWAASVAGEDHTRGGRREQDERDDDESAEEYRERDG